MKRKKKKKLIKKILIILIPILLFIGGYYIYNNYIKRPGIPSVNKLIDDKKSSGYPKEEEKDINNYVNQLPELRNQYGNSDIMGRLEIPGLNIDTVIVRTNDNDYYLDNNLNKQWDGLGVPFFDYRNLNLASDRQINIYGHNTQKTEFYDQLPFTNLEAYMDEQIFKTYNNIYLSIDERQMVFEVVATKLITDRNNEHMLLVFSDDIDYLQHVNRLLKDTIYQSKNAYFTGRDRMLILQICHYEPMDSYLLIIGKEKK